MELKQEHEELIEEYGVIMGQYNLLLESDYAKSEKICSLEDRVDGLRGELKGKDGQILEFIGVYHESEMDRKWIGNGPERDRK